MIRSAIALFVVYLVCCTEGTLKFNVVVPRSNMSPISITWTPLIDKIKLKEE